MLVAENGWGEQSSWSADSERVFYVKGPNLYAKRSLAIALPNEVRRPPPLPASSKTGTKNSGSGRSSTRPSSHAADPFSVKYCIDRLRPPEFPENASLIGARRYKKLERRRKIDDIFNDHERWMKDTLTTDDSPYLRLAAVFVG